MRKNIKYLHFSPEGMVFLKAHEGLKLYVYDDATQKRFNGKDPHHGHATVGYGHKLKQDELKDYYVGRGLFSRKDKDITPIQAEALLENDIQAIETCLKKLVSDKLWLTQAQYDAIVDFAFNVGTGKNTKKIKSGFAGSFFLLMLNKGRFEGSLMAHFHRPKQIMKSRRIDEIILFDKGLYQLQGVDMFKDE